MTIGKFGLAAFAGVIGMANMGTALAEATVESRAAFVEAYVYGCQPVEYDFAGAREDLDAAADAVYEEVFLGQYGGSCQGFYFAEVVPRLDFDQLPYFVTVAR